MNNSTSQTTWLSVLVFIFVGSIIYSNTLNVPFYFDDYANIKKPAIQVENGTCGEFARVLHKGTLQNRPVSNLSFALNYYFGGYRVQGYHLVNIFIHIASAICLYFLFYYTLCLPPNREKYFGAQSVAFLASLVWLVHPVATQSVTYVVQRMNSMATMFYLLAVLCYVLGRNRQRCLPPGSKFLSPLFFFISSAVAGLLSAGSKEIAITLPVILFLYEVYFFQDLSWKWLKQKLVWGIGIFVSVFVVSYIYLGSALFTFLSLECPNRNFNLLERIFTQFRVIVYYLGLLIYPAPNRLVLDYDFPISLSITTPLSTLFSFLFLVLLVALGGLFAKKERLLSFCIIWFFLNLMLESSVICLEMVYEHRTYLSSSFLCLLFVGIAFRVFHNKHVFVAIISLVCILFSFWTIQRNAVWQNSLNFGKHEVSVFPHNARSLNNLGLTLANDGKLQEAEKIFHRALEDDPSAEIVHKNLGDVSLHIGDRVGAESYFRKAIKIKPDYTEARFSLAVLLRRNGAYNEAITHFSILQKKQPENGVLNKNLGNSLLRSGKPQQGMVYLKIAQSQIKADTEIGLDIAEALSRLGDVDNAIKEYKRVLLIDQQEEKAHYNLALLLQQKGESEEAISHFRSAQRLTTYPMEMLYNYGNQLLRSGNVEEAEKVYGSFLQVIPTVINTLNNLGLVFVQEKKYKKAVQCFSLAIAMDPSSQMIQNNLQMAQMAQKSLQKSKP